ncbi:glutamic acid-rich protein isoform X2 [Hibiscus syriacus]|uniref:glutamic acid-rich protein isoform X2 n=1 Tax=Hibiscus syriacus TaxID=106335 RepID=UPI001920AFD8|nr:glutamic acid-rich protein isoform X2 [Hibiscus syriacus]
MDSDNHLELVSPPDETSPPIQERKLKRLKKVKTVSENPSSFEALDFRTPEPQLVEEPKSRSVSEGSFDEKNESSSGFDELGVEGNGSGSVAKRALDFDTMTEEVDGTVEGQSQDKGIRDFEPEESEKKRPSFEETESRRTKKNKRVKGVGDGEMPILPERRTAKERREYLVQLRAESQRLLRETTHAAFQPAPIVQKPISSVLEKIRRRRLEVARKTYFDIDDHDGSSSKDMAGTGFEDVAEDERGNEREFMEVESEETIVKYGISDTLCSDEIKNAENGSSHGNLSPQVVSSSDNENNDKENIDPQPHESVELSPTTNGDPVKAFVDEEAEEEDDSDHDLGRFQDDNNEDDEDAEDIEELRDMIATGYEEKQSDVDRRMELHQKLLDQQDAAKTAQLLRKWGPKHREAALLDDEGFEEDEEEEEEDGEEFSENEEDSRPVNMRMHIKKIKEMLPQMFTDKDDMYISSDEEETEKKLVEQSLSDKANQQAGLLPPSKDARSKKLFGYIKVNNMPETRKKAKTSSFSNMLFMGKKGNESSKSSFIGRGSNCSIPSSTKQGSGILRSFVFEREDNNSKSTTTMAESSEVIRSSAQRRKEEMETSSGVQLLEILTKSSSLQTSECSGSKRSIVGHTESIFAAFKLEKKSVGTKRPNVSVKPL